ncbi:hypothetical protein [Endozoicomonas sp. 8E]|uniref:hypothetical protein n=1 Tax=Endozoicomonas sp. 8E TaxID=3035692 RepID=UPI002938D20F|nr:hypothetical protein [Endozoicomonas sp. 8E]WOG25703.1 hypothetical protein P6910_14070 [Endozoicomonas sp. 8E]
MVQDLTACSAFEDKKKLTLFAADIAGVLPSHTLISQEKKIMNRPLVFLYAHLNYLNGFSVLLMMILMYNRRDSFHPLNTLGSVTGNAENRPRSPHFR